MLLDGINLGLRQTDFNNCLLIISRLVQSKIRHEKAIWDLPIRINLIPLTDWSHYPWSRCISMLSYFYEYMYYLKMKMNKTGDLTEIIKMKLTKFKFVLSFSNGKTLWNFKSHNTVVSNCRDQNLSNLFFPLRWDNASCSHRK